MFEALEPRLLLSTLYWDPDTCAANNCAATGEGLGGTGEWNLTSNYWWAAGAGSNVAWNNSNGDTAVFFGTQCGQAAGPVPLTTGIAVGGMSFKTSGYTVQDNTLTLSNSGISVDNDVAATISSQISGSCGLTKSGGGALTLSGDNDYQGTTCIGSGGELVVAAAGSLPDNPVYNYSCGELIFDQSFDGTFSGAICGSGSVTIAGSVTLDGDNSGSSGVVTIEQSGTLRVSSCSNLPGNSVVNNGTLNIDGGSGSFNNISGGGWISVTGSCVALGSLCGDQSLTVSCSGNVALGSSGYTGSTTVESGSTLWASGGSLHGDVVNDGDLIFSGWTNETYSGSISGSGTVTITGGGEITFTGSNSYTGGTTIAQGILVAGVNALPQHSGGGYFAAGQFTLSIVGSAADVADILKGPGVKEVESVAAADGAEAIPEDETLASFADAQPDGEAAAGGSLKAHQFVLDIAVDQATLTGVLARPFKVKGYLSLTRNASGALVVAKPDACGKGSSTTDGPVDAAADATPSESAESAKGASPLDIAVDPAIFAHMTAALRVRECEVRLVRDDSGALVLTAADSALSGEEVGFGLLSLTCGEDVFINSGASLVFEQNGAGEYDGWIGGYGSVTVTGCGTDVTLSGENTYGGCTTVDEGATLHVTTCSLPGNVVVNGTLELSFVGACEYGGTISGGGVVAVYGVDVAESTLCGTTYGQVSLTVSDLTLSGTITGGVSLTVSGEVVLGGTNNYTGGTAIEDGTLSLGADNALPTCTTVTLGDGSCAGGILRLNGHSQELAGLASCSSGVNRVVNGIGQGSGALTLNMDTDGEFAGTLGASCTDEDDFSVTKIGCGTLTLSGANTYMGPTTIRGGALRAAQGYSLPESNLIFDGGVWESYGYAQFTRGLGTGVGEVQWTGDGGFSAYGGKLTVNIGGSETPDTLEWGGCFVPTGSRLLFGSSTANSEVEFVNDIVLGEAARTISVADNPGCSCDVAVLSGVLSGESGGLVKNGAGTLVLGGANTYGGETAIESGTLRVTTRSLSGDTTVSEGATLAFVQSDDGTYERDISGAGNVTIDGGGSILFSGQNDHTGLTTISAGTLQITTCNLVGNVVNDGNLFFYQNFSGTYAGDISGTGEVTLSGDATITISGTVSAQRLMLTGQTHIAGQGTIYASMMPGQPRYYVDDVHTVTTGCCSKYTFESLGYSLSHNRVTTEPWQDVVRELLTYYGVRVLEDGNEVATLFFPEQDEQDPGFKVGTAGEIACSLGEKCHLLDLGLKWDDKVIAINYDDPCSCGDGDYDDGVIRITVKTVTVEINNCGDIKLSGHNSSDISCFGVRRIWTNEGQYTPVNRVGAGWGIIQWPLIRDAGAGRVVVSAVDQDVRWFDYDYDTGVYDPGLSIPDSLVHTGGEFVLTDKDGNVTRFYDFSSSLPYKKRGQFKSLTDAGGNLIQVTSHTDDGNIAEVQCSLGGGVTDSFVYTYLSSGDNAGLMSGVTHRRKVGSGDWSTINQLEYAYYGSSENYGSVGDLKTAVVKDASGNTLETKYYRYYKAGDANGYPHALKYAFEGRSYARLAHDFSNPFTATDAQVAPYADRYQEYDIQHRVTKQVLAGAGDGGSEGGQGTYTYAYDVSGNTDGYNSWRFKTVQTLPDGNRRILYSNYLGQIMLEVFEDVAAGKEWCTFHKYDDSRGLEVFTASPSAFELHSGKYYDESYADLLHADSYGHYEYLDDDDGLIAVAAYYTVTSPGISETVPGGVEGYLHTTSLRHGELGTAVPQSHLDYVKRTAGGTTVYPVHSGSVYRNTNGTGEETYTYTYTWFTDKVRTQSLEVSLPIVSTGQNGSGTANSTTTFYDSFGRPIWTKDTDDFLFYTEYDSATETVSKTIADVDTTKTYDFSNLPSGWSTPTGGGLHLITLYEPDAEGRTTKVTDPGGNVTYAIYNDINCETRVYAGWSASTGRPTGPTVVYRDDRAHGYFETLTISTAPHLTNGQPDGTETLVAADILSLSRSYANPGGQTTKADAYFSLSGLTYSADPDLGTEGTHFLRTVYAYDALGLPARAGDATDTIRRTVRDALGRVISQWTGTDDTPDSGTYGDWRDWSPTNTAGANMVKTAEFVYDGGGVGNGDLTLSKVFAADSTHYDTCYQYDWRDRLIGTRGADKVAAKMDYDNLGEVTCTQTYADANTDFVIDSEELRGQVEYSYDELGRVYRTCTYEINPQTRCTEDYLVTNFWYNARGMVMKTADANGLFQKTAYDGAGRVVASYVSFDTDDTEGSSAYAGAGSVAGDTVIEQTERIYLPGKSAWQEEESYAQGTIVSYAGGAYIATTETTEGYDPLNHPEEWQVFNAGSTVTNLSFQRLESDMTSCGELTADMSYATASVTWYDRLGRVTHAINFGHDGSAGGYIFDGDGDLVDADSDGVLDEADPVNDTTQEPNEPREPNTCDDYIVTKYEYNEAQFYTQTIDNKGHKTRTYYDLAGRTVRTIANYDDGVEATDTDTDQTTEYDYDSAGRLSIVRARNPKGTYIEDQETQYLYESEINRSWVTNVIYPDSADIDGPYLSVGSLISSGTTATATVSGHGYSEGDLVRVRGAAQAEYDGWFTIHVVDVNTFTYTLAQSAASPATGTITVKRIGQDEVLTTYDRLGRTVTVTDQRGVVHAYSYDTAGRLEADAVINETLPEGVDGSVRRIEWAYDDLGRVSLVTSYDAAEEGDVVNQVAFAYNGWGMVSESRQEHAGEVDQDTPVVQYAYDDTDPSPHGAVPYVRLESVTYPDAGRAAYYNYPAAGTVGGVLSRLDNIASCDDPEEEDTFVAYTYLGAGTITQVEHPAVEGGLTLTYGSAGNYTGWDRFSRVVDQKWQTGGETPTIIDRFQYTYDYNSNRTSRDVTAAGAPTNLDEYYTYDDLDRLASFKRGTLSGGEITHANSTFEQEWDILDSLGNWQEFSEDADGGGESQAQDQSRTHDEANELTGITGNLNWVDPLHDDAGNMILAPRPGQESCSCEALILVYDGWNRLAKVYKDSNSNRALDTGSDTLVATYAYDGQGRRVTRTAGETTTHYFFNENWQVLETRVGTDPDPLDQYVWDVRYVDAPVVRFHNGNTDEDYDDPEDNILYYTQDANWNVTALVDSGTGAVVERYIYSAYGEVTVLDEDWDPVEGNESAVANDRLFTGSALDSETGLYSSRVRDTYHPTLGRWLERDPAGYVEGMNLYEYVGSNPANLTDPMGLCGGTAPGPKGPQGAVGSTGSDTGSSTGSEGGSSTGSEAVSSTGSEARRYEGFWGKLRYLWDYIRDFFGAIKGLGQALIPDEKTVPLSGDPRFKPAMDVIKRLARTGVLPGPAAAEIGKLVAAGAMKGYPGIEGASSTVSGHTVITTAPQYNVGDMVMNIVGEWQQHPVMSHGYNNTSRDTKKKDDQMLAVQQALDKMAQETGNPQYSPGEKWRHQTQREGVP
ncbi:MAG: autotransporter-associated beta strand repeat-containing protein [Planctomycetota bacterium]|nr:autotransporter-associated beta strand repeat-containing protein [Planctomycetota bacterium]